MSRVSTIFLLLLILIGMIMIISWFMLTTMSAIQNSNVSHKGLANEGNDCIILQALNDNIASASMATDIYLFHMENRYRFLGTHSESCLFTMAILITESGGRFKLGSHGECGPYQIKPSTYREVVPGTKHLTIHGITTWLMTDHLFGLRGMFALMNRYDTMQSALTHYNHGRHGSVYAKKVMFLYDKYCKQYMNRLYMNRITTPTG